MDDGLSSVLTIDPSELDQLRSNVLKSQIATYRLLARNLPVPDSLLQACSFKSQLAALLDDRLEKDSQSIHPTAICIADDDQNGTDAPVSFSSATNMYRWLVGANETDDKIPVRTRQHPIGLNPLYVQQEREKRYDPLSTAELLILFISLAFLTVCRLVFTSSSRCLRR